MSTPTTFFIDTSVFRQNGYNFDTSSLTVLRDFCKKTNAVMLLPDPIEREIRRHLKQNSDDAVKSLEAIQKKTPFLKKLKDWPYTKTSSQCLRFQLKRQAEKELESFLSDVNVKRLDYSNVKIERIMDLYDKCSPPFSSKKRKEFPDAFALEILTQFSALDEAVAVISLDNDFKNACNTHFHLHSFQSIAQYLESINKQSSIFSDFEFEDEDYEQLDEQITDTFKFASFSIDAHWEGTVENIEIDEIEYEELSIVSAGENDVTVMFEAKINYNSDVSYPDYDNAMYDKEFDTYFHLGNVNTNVSDQETVTGICKWSFKNNPLKLNGIEIFEMDQDDFFVQVEQYYY